VDEVSPPREVTNERAVVAALLGIYLAWGATYLAIAIAVKTLPPLLMAGLRFITAGGLLLLVLRLRGEKMPALVEWRSCLVVGALLFGGGNGPVSLVSGAVPSSLIALIIALTPLCISLVSLVMLGERPARITWVSIVLGLLGVIVLVGTPDRRSLASVTEIGYILFAIFAWSVGSVLSKKLPLPNSTAVTTGAQLLMGGFVLTAWGLFRGEHVGLDLAEGSFASWMAMLYLVVIGSLVGFGAFAYLLKHAEPAVATSYAYVNPVIALALGHTLAREPVDVRTLFGAAIIVTAVALLLRYGKKR
jgi:drug/metabolite transporter (DMT)-like permease